MVKPIPAVFFAALLASGCGTTPEERSVSGAGIGAGAGAIVGAVSGLSVLEGAALGAVAGALTGALTKEEDIYLGNPAWKQGAGEKPASPEKEKAAAYRDVTPEATGVPSTVVAQVQEGLAKLGYSPGPVDGIYGPKTRQAVRRYQQDNGLPVDGQVTQSLADHIDSLVRISLITI